MMFFGFIFIASVGFWVYGFSYGKDAYGKASKFVAEWPSWVKWLRSMVFDRFA